MVETHEVREWLIEKIAVRTGSEKQDVRPDMFFDEFDLDSTEALVLAGELEEWLGFALAPTALWYFPTIEKLAEHVASSSEPESVPR
ncbi:MULTISPECIES: acyl carrier protein [Clavibacter]|uniref:Acyl carrier protein n=2 Tax=Clavibacter TaxID=1573 RepID=A0A399NRN2_9MICO|nr:MULTISPECIES: acyl carrier protein [Clavibacter]RII96387.1 acyl carrier protein [Clavibacter michiganensis]UKF25310.1 acyl carrier protein [Clavibacter sp. A6099]